jgi:hypothetical protein
MKWVVRVSCIKNENVSLYLLRGLKDLENTGEEDVFEEDSGNSIHGVGARRMLIRK